MTHSQLECLIATSVEARQQVYRLRYQCYRRDGSIEPRPDEQFSDNFDALPNSFSLLLRTGNVPLATVRITVVRKDRGWCDSPAQHVFTGENHLGAIAGEHFVEASRLCFAQQARRDAFVRLVGHMAAAASFYDAAWLVACPRVEHAASYVRMFGFQPIASPRQYYGVNFQTQLLATRRTEIQNYVSQVKPLTNAWHNALAQLAREPSLSVAKAVGA